MKLRVVAGLLVTVACSDSSSTPDPIPDAERDVLFSPGDPLRVLADDLNELPVTLAAFEERFRVGRRCTREDSHEVYATEERSSRYGGKQRPADALLPRVAITGCESERESHSILIAETSPATPGDAHTTATDPIATSPVEVMSFDATVGRYAFYELLEFDGVRHLVRIERRADGSIVVHDKEQGKPLRTQTTTAPRCFGCHVHGEPMLGELSDPWFGWLSSNKLQPERADYTGSTQELLAEGKHPSGRTSLASSLEVTVRKGLSALAGGGALMAAGAARDLAARAMFCPVQLGFVSKSASYPDALFVDPAVLRGLGVALAPVTAGDVPVVQIPVRGQADESLANGLVAKGFLPARLSLALRVYDDLDDLSARRCALWQELGEGWTDDDAGRATRLAEVLRRNVADDGTPRARYLRALIDDLDADTLAGAYAQDVLQRAAAHAAELDRWLPAELERRSAVARALFDRPENPLPLP